MVNNLEGFCDDELLEEGMGDTFMSREKIGADFAEWMISSFWECPLKSPVRLPCILSRCVNERTEHNSEKSENISNQSQIIPFLKLQPWQKAILTWMNMPIPGDRSIHKMVTIDHLRTILGPSRKWPSSTLAKLAKWARHDNMWLASKDGNTPKSIRPTTETRYCW